MYFVAVPGYAGERHWKAFTEGIVLVGRAGQNVLVTFVRFRTERRPRSHPTASTEATLHSLRVDGVLITTRIGSLMRRVIKSTSHVH